MLSIRNYWNLLKYELLRVITSHDECPYIFFTQPELPLLVFYRKIVSSSSAWAMQQESVIKT